MKILWIVLIFLYIFGMPIILVHMHTKLTQSEDRLVSLETRFNKHLGIIDDDDSSSSANVKTMKYTSDNKVGVEREKTLKLNYDLRLQLEKLNQMVQEQKKRYTIIWFNLNLERKRERF